MDNYIIVLLGIVFFIYRTYANYQKEQEAAKKRNPNAPASTKPRSENPQPNVDIPKWLQDFLPPQPEAHPQHSVQKTQPESLERRSPTSLVRETSQPAGSIGYEPIAYKKTVYVPMKNVATERPADLLSEYRNLPEKQEIEELKRSVAIHKAHKHEFKRLHAFVLDEEEGEIKIPAFNLREAIITTAILERPYH